jgi:hypothetical protein
MAVLPDQNDEVSVVERAVERDLEAGRMARHDGVTRIVAPH